MRRHDAGVCHPITLKKYFIRFHKESASLPSSSSSSMPIFSFLGLFTMSPKVPRFIPVVWEIPLPKWIKVNNLI